MLKFKHLKDRIHAFILTLLAIILVLVMVMVNQANMDNASEQVLHDIRANGNIFNSAIRESSFHLIVSARLLSSDYAFKKAYATYDRATILSAMQNHLDRLESADLMLIMDIDDGVIIASTGTDVATGNDSPVPELILMAEDDDYLEASGYGMLDGALYQFVLVPLMVPNPVAWIAIGFRIDNNYLQQFKQLSSSDISLYVESADARPILASTLAENKRGDLSAWLHGVINVGESDIVAMQGEDFLTHTRALDDSKSVTAVLQRSLDGALRPYLNL